jgi:NAD(P)-dependent dehydrogenase (short-subunit alcohol dehydrogenase family)
MANEWAGHRINVNAIAPGYMATNNTQQLRDDAERSKAILDRIPAGRWGVPDDLQGPVVFLASGRRITSAAIRWRLMAAGWRADDFVTKSYTVTSFAHCIKTLYCMN